MSRYCTRLINSTCFHVPIFQRNLNEFPWYNKVDSMSSRFVEKPNIPVVNKIENNYYFQRDLVKMPRLYHIIILWPDV